MIYIALDHTQLKAGQSLPSTSKEMRSVCSEEVDFANHFTASKIFKTALFIQGYAQE